MKKILINLQISDSKQRIMKDFKKLNQHLTQIEFTLKKNNLQNLMDAHIILEIMKESNIKLLKWKKPNRFITVLNQ